MNNRNVIAAAGLCLLLCACGNADSFRETLGLNRKGPDEYQVVSRPPLTVPPEFSLVAPKQGAEYSPPVSAEDQAHNKILGMTGSGSGAVPSVPDINAAPVPQNAQANNIFAAPVQAVSTGELPTSSDAQFLTDAGTNKANPHIRQELYEDNANNVQPPAKKSDTLLAPKTEGDPQVDPVKEADRLKQDKAQGLPPTAGDTPTVQQQSSVLGNIFR